MGPVAVISNQDSMLGNQLAVTGPPEPRAKESHRGAGFYPPVGAYLCAAPASEIEQPSSAKRRPTGVSSGKLGLGSQVHHANSFSAVACSGPKRHPQKGGLVNTHLPLGGVSRRPAESRQKARLGIFVNGNATAFPNSRRKNFS